MSFEKLEAFIALAKETGVSELKYEKDGEKFEVSLRGQPEIIKTHFPQAEPPGAKAESDLFEITSPFVGTFYKASSPGAKPFAQVGEKIAPGKVLCIIEAMKIMNEIESDVSGEVVEVCVENENYVEFGQVLFRVRLS